MTMTLRPSYATPDDWAHFHEGAPYPVTPTEDAALTASLRRASRVVDEVMIAEVYEVDDDFMPVEERVRGLLAEAACLQHAYFLETGDVEGAGEYAGVRPNRHAPAMVAHLRANGLLNANVSHG